LVRIFSRAAGLLVMAWVGPVSSFAQAPALVPSTSQVTLNAVANGPAPLPQVFTVAAADGSFVNIETLVDAGSPDTPAPAWITVTPHLATTPMQVQLAANPAGLKAGTYSARIQFTNTTGVSLGTPVAVTFQVTSPETADGPQFTVSPTVLSLSDSISQAYMEAGIFVRSLGPGTLGPVSVTVLSGYPWLSAVAPACDTLCVITVRVAVGALQPGAITGLLQVNTAMGSANVPVSLFVADDGPFVQLEPQGLQFNAIQDTGLMDSTTFTLQNTGDAPSDFTAYVVDGADWLSIDTPSGTVFPGTPTQITATISPGIMGPGEYGGLIAVAGSFNPLYVPVVLRIDDDSTPPVPLLSTGGLVFQTQVNAEGQELPVTLSAGSASTVSYEASSQSAGWLSAGPMRGGVSGAVPAPLNVIGAPLGLLPGFYSGLVNIAFGAGPLRSLNVGLSVVDPTATNCKPQFLYLTETALSDSFGTWIGYPTPLQAVLVDDCGNFVSNGFVSASFSNGDPDIVLESLGQGQYAGTWTPGHASSALANGVAIVAETAYSPGFPLASTDLSGTVANDTAPTLGANAVLNNLNPQLGSPLAPGTVVQIYGTSLGTTNSGTVVNGQLSTTLSGVSVSVGGIAAPLYYASNGQINAQLPNELEPGQQYELLAEVNGLYSNPVTINIVAAQPGLASLPDGTVIAQDANYNLITAGNPAHAGDVIILYATGMGPTNPPVATGAVAPSSTLAQVVIAPLVSIGGKNAQVQFAGLSPGSVGLYQIDVVIPTGAGTGDVPLVVTQGGVASNTVNVPLQ